MSGLPPVKIGTTFFARETCAVCRREWSGGQTPVPTVYTIASIEAELPPEPVCDHCVEQHDPDLFAELMADRKYFWEN
jgi:hypothetical protein